MLPSELKIGVIGLGKMGMLHLEKLSLNNRIALSGVWDIDSTKTEAAAKLFNVKPFPDSDSLFLESDAVVIASPTPTHFALARQAFDHDLHVFLEKPLAQTLSEGQELVRIASKKNKILQTGFLERYRWMRLQHTVPDLWSSRPKLILSERSSSEPSRDPQADIVTDLMIHDIDFVLWTFGKKPSTVHAEGISLRGRGLDLAYARLSFDSGEVAHLKAQWVAPQRIRNTQVFWDKNRLHFNLLTQEANSAEFNETRLFQNRKWQIAGPDPLTDQINAFVSAIEGSTALVVDGHQGCSAQEVCEAIKKSIQERTKLSVATAAEKHSPSLQSQGDYVN